MLSIVADSAGGRRSGRFCDGLTRRDMLRVGSLTVGGLSLPEILRAEQTAGVRGAHKSVIMIYMCGAPAHQDMYDMKMDAPAEIRGEFRPIPTRPRFFFPVNRGASGRFQLFKLDSQRLIFGRNAGITDQIAGAGHFRGDLRTSLHV